MIFVSQYDLCQPGEGGKSSGGNYSKWPPPVILLGVETYSIIV